jgi:transposase
LDILTLHRRGLKQRAIARKLGISRNTVKKYIDKPELAFEPALGRKRSSQLDAYQDNIKAWIEEDSDYRASWIYDRLSNMGFAGSCKSKTTTIKWLTCALRPSPDTRPRWILVNFK